MRYAQLFLALFTLLVVYVVTRPVARKGHYESVCEPNGTACSEIEWVADE